MRAVGLDAGAKRMGVIGVSHAFTERTLNVFSVVNKDVLARSVLFGNRLRRMPANYTL